MIYYDRSKVEKPGILESERVLKEIEQMREFYAQGKHRKQRDYRWKSEFVTHGEVRKKLQSLFEGKCAYCERYISDQSDVDHFRPKRNAMNLDGTVNEDFYWWLTYEWENLYLSCKECNHSKRSRFPIEGRRITESGNLNEEKALLIDPCRKEDFEEINFKYADDGVIIPLNKKAEITIEVFNLNRSGLISGRKGQMEYVSSIIENWSRTLKEKSFAMFRDGPELIEGLVLNSNQPHASIWMSTAMNFYKRNPNSPFAVDLSKVYNNDESDKYQSPNIYTGNIDTGTGNIDIGNISGPEFADKKFQTKMDYSMDLESEEEKEAYFTAVKRIKSVEINNFKIIESLKLDFPKSNSNEEPWMVLLGENGSGKSSVMQAIALTMVGARRANELGLKASNFVNRNTRTKSGYVKISMDGLQEPLELHFSKDSDEFSSNFEESKVIMLAFGSTRLMANEDDLDSEQNLTSLKNLFNPYATLPNIEEWIADPKQVPVKEFDRIAFELKKILQLPDDKLVYRRKSKEGKHELFVRINSFKTGIRLKELSSGYQSIIAMTLNIIKTILETWGSFSIAEGIVLIDEIGVHLHPKWKLQIIRTLRDIFPAMTFIITTHEPLCLRGVNEGEVVLMKFNEENEVIALTELPSPKGLTVEQLISSKFFGLITSFDPEVELQLNSYYLLKSKLERNKAEQDQLKEIESNLGKYQILDKTKDEILKDEILKPDINIGWISSPSKQEDLKQAIKSIWDETI